MAPQTSCGKISDNIVKKSALIMINSIQFKSFYRGLLACLALLILSVGAQAQTLDTRLFYDNGQARNLQISPDGQHIAFNFDYETEVRLAILNLESMQPTALFEFGENQHVLNFFWGSDSRVIMEVGRVTGFLDDTGRPSQLFAADVTGDNRRQIFDAQRSSYQVLNPLIDDPDHILIARYHFADGGQPKAHLLNIHRGSIHYLADQPQAENIRFLGADQFGEVRVAVEFEQGDTFDDFNITLHLKHGDNWRQLEVDPARQPVDISPLGFSADLEHFYFTSNHDLAENDRTGLFRYRFADNSYELLYRHPDVDISGTIRDFRGEVLGVTTSLGPATYYFLEDKVETNRDAILMQQLARAFPNDDVSLTSFTRNGEQAIVFARGDRNPGQFFLFNTETLQAEFLQAALPELPGEALAPMQSVRIPARDGLELHGLLTRPLGQTEPGPLLVEVHGGPFGVADLWGFKRDAQFFAHHGYSTLQVNFRGSGNRGFDFVAKGRREWGGKMQDDVTDATLWAIEQGIADPNRICIWGGSYGGYAALMGVIKEPDLYQCSVGIVGVFDLLWFRDGDGSDVAQQRRGGRQGRAAFERFFSANIGDDRDMLRRNSPVHNVDAIKADLFIVHGGSDVRVPVGHAHRLRDALNAIGKPFEWMIKEEEGHGFFNVDNRVELAEAMLAFFERNIGNAASASDDSTAQID